MAQRSGSILAVDFGNVYTRAVLIDLVDGVYRLVARAEGRTTNQFPVADVGIGLRRVLQQLTEVTGRPFLTPDGRIISPEQPDRSGVDEFVATTSTGRPLRTVMVGLVPEVSIASALRAAAGTYVELVETLSLEDFRSEQERLNAIVASRPDLIFIAGGTEEGATEPVLELAQVVRLALQLLQKSGRKPLVLYAGNSALAAPVRALFEGLTTVLVAPNIRPALDEEDLEGAQAQLGRAFDRQQVGRGGGFEGVAVQSRLGVLPTAQSYRLITEYLSRTLGGGVLTVDVGSAVSTLSTAFDGRVTTVIRTDIGLGHSAESLLNIVGKEAVESWLPFVTTPNQVRHYALNKTLRPATITETLKGLYMEHGLLRTGIRVLLETARPQWANAAADLTPPLALIIGAGSGLTRTGHPGFNALLLLDAIQPTGVTLLRADAHGLIAALGALAAINPEAVVQVADGGSLERLGQAVSVTGQPAFGKTALRVRITTADGAVIRQDVLGGHLWVYPLGVGRKAEVEVRTARGLSIGGKRRVRFEAIGGSAGLIFDARGRPLVLGDSPQARAAQMPMWVSEVTGDPIREIEDPMTAVGDIEDTASTAPVPATEALRRGGTQPRRSAVTRGFAARRAAEAAPELAETPAPAGRFGRKAAKPAPEPRPAKPARGRGKRGQAEPGAADEAFAFEAFDEGDDSLDELRR